ncbi:MAG TPA: chemotaxis protein CheA [Vicinamibacterales bacterium]|jgi:two-component system chemotaxis sensor kinase CheA
MDERPDFIASFMDDYFAESEEHLATARQHLLLLEAAMDHDELPATIVDELFRSFHSLKGISAMVELREAEQLAHEMESCLSRVRERRSVLTPPVFETLVSATNVLEQVIVAHREGSAIPSIDQLLDQFTAVCSASSSRQEEPPATATVRTHDLASPIRVTFTPTADLITRGVKVDTIRTRLSEIGHIERVAPQITKDGGIVFEFLVTGIPEDTLRSWRDDGVSIEAFEQAAVPRPVDVPAAPHPRLTATSPGPANYVRVDLGRLDDLMRFVSDLVVSRARLEDTLLRVESYVPAAIWRTLEEHTESIERQLRDLREGVMRVRLVPVSEIFRRMPFVVRDLARDAGKQVQLELAGQSTEIDKFLIERMMDPVLHLVRNAVSHGIESPEERITAGKRPDGTIRLAASTIGDSVVIEVSDDGRGMDADAIARRARDAGLDLPPGELDSQALLDVICSSGFSTRDQADRASGRGIGMSVVRGSIQELGGSLSVVTGPGAGTTFRAVLPLTLAITDALIVHVGSRTFAVPQSAVQEVAEIDCAAVRAIEHNELVVHRGMPLPVVRLARLFGIDAPERQRLHVIIIGTGLGAVGILVDRISGQREIVVKMLHDPLVTMTGISGATELGDGRLVLILDVIGLTRTLRHRGSAIRAAV